MFAATATRTRAADTNRSTLSNSTQPPAMTVEETRDFMKRLAQFVFDHHLKKTSNSPQRGMIYEYFDPSRAGQFDQFVQGEALDTMHDGAWFAVAMVNAHRATGDPFYKELLTRWILPFYLKMLNHSDTLFSSQRNDARPRAAAFDREHRLQDGEKGFVPYWWDDGGSVSLERHRDQNLRSPFGGTDFPAGKPNPNYQLVGFSHGSSNHLAQDVAVMLQMSWLLLRDSPVDSDKKLAAEVAEAARNLHQCRVNHFGHIPMCCAATALINGDLEELKRVPAQTWPTVEADRNHYANALYHFRTGQREPFPAFADEQQYRYYFSLARYDGLPRPLAFKIIYDAYTGPMLYRYYSDNAEVPPGINIFDLHPYHALDGKPADYRSDRQGVAQQPRPIGSRMGPQNMVTTGWALQALKAYPGVWEERYKSQFSNDVRVTSYGAPPGIYWVAPPNTNGVNLGDVTLALTSTKRFLMINGESRKPEAVFKIFSRPDALGSHARFTLRQDKPAVAVNDRGETLLLKSSITNTTGGFTFAVQIPYTIQKDQKTWMNGVEQERYSVQSGEMKQNFYLMSREKPVAAWLEYELGKGLRTWEAIFKAKGYIPTSMGAGEEWDRFSDAGGYAHLISAGAQWILYQESKRDWEIHNVPK